MATGTVKWFDTKQGFGFIKPNDEVNEIFLHVDELEKADIKFVGKFALQGLRVTYDVGVNKHNKPAAVNIKVTMKKISGMKTGTIKWYNETKGFGFIAPQDGSKDIFIHFSELAKANIKNFIKKNLIGTFIGYEIFTDHKGRASAINVHLLDK